MGFICFATSVHEECHGFPLNRGGSGGFVENKVKGSLFYLDDVAEHLDSLLYVIWGETVLGVNKLPFREVDVGLKFFFIGEKEEKLTCFASLNEYLA